MNVRITGLEALVELHAHHSPGGIIVMVAVAPAGAVGQVFNCALLSFLAPSLFFQQIFSPIFKL
jgi:hypothetical protein